MSHTSSLFHDIRPCPIRTLSPFPAPRKVDRDGFRRKSSEKLVVTRDSNRASYEPKGPRVVPLHNRSLCSLALALFLRPSPAEAACASPPPPSSLPLLLFRPPPPPSSPGERPRTTSVAPSDDRRPLGAPRLFRRPRGA